MAVPFVAPLALVEMTDTCIRNGDESWTCAAVLDWTGNETLARATIWLVGKPSAIVGLVLLGIIGRWLIHKVIDRLVTRAQAGILPPQLARGPFAESTSDSSGTRRAQRAITMGSLLKSIVTSVILIVVVIMTISELGYDIAPLIAGAGIIGVAFGFGAQSLVKDFLSGIFMIFEDQYGVGDVIDVGEVSGTVEAVTLRVTRLRDVNGTVWYLRNGELLQVGNQSQNWARSVLDISVGYSEDLSRVRRVLTDVAHELAEDPTFGPLVLGEPSVWGVQSLDADGIAVRVALKTVPLEQWRVSREMRERIKERFDAEGIEIPFPQRVVWHKEAPAAEAAAESGSEETGA